MQSLKAAKNYQIETYTIDSDFLGDPTFFKRLETKRDAPLNLMPNSKPGYHFSEKAHPLNEYIEISDRLYHKQLQSNIEKHPSRKFKEYTIEKTDTLYGLALKFDVSPESIKNLNFLTEDSSLFPGQIISIPIIENLEDETLHQDLQKVGSFALEDFKEWLEEESKNEENKEEEGTCLEDLLLRRKSSDGSFINFKNNLLVSMKGESGEMETFRYEAYYCTSYGDIKGVITINEFLLLFDPLATSKEKNTYSLDFQVCLDLQDVIDAFLIGLPNKYCDEQYQSDPIKKDFNKDFFLEVNVSRIGDKDIEKKYRERIKTMTDEKLALATIFFKVYDHIFEEEIKNQQKCAIASEIQKKLTELTKYAQSNKKNSESAEKNSTKIPFFDILYENLFKTSSKKSKNYKSKSIIRNLNLFGVLPVDPKESMMPDIDEVPDFIPKMMQDSNVLTSDHFLQILDYIPPSLKLRNWKLVYSNITHGMSLTTLFFRSEEIGPNIVVVQDFNGWVFGGFCSSSWERGQQFYGKGESFLFSFKDGRKINCYLWTGKNYDFQFADSDGLAMGAGNNYGHGLFIKGDLLAGRSHVCETFENEVLSKENDFEIRFLEIWGCDEFIDI